MAIPPDMLKELAEASKRLEIRNNEIRTLKEMMEREQNIGSEIKSLLQQYLDSLEALRDSTINQIDSLLDLYNKMKNGSCPLMIFEWQESVKFRDPYEVY